MQETPALFSWQRGYLLRNWRFVLSVSFALAWASFSIFFSLPWFNDLATIISWPLAIFAIAGIAIIPGYLNAFLLASLVVDRPQLLPDAKVWPPLDVVIAAYNEEKNIAETVRAVKNSDYPGQLTITVVDDGSEDKTGQEAKAAGAIVLNSQHGGKAAALNSGLAAGRHRLVATLDADTLLTKHALRHATSRLLARKGAGAAAGAVMVRNSRDNWLTKIQEWDYQIGIGSVKRVQGLWGATLVAQGSFSLFHRHCLQEVGGWKQRSGEDIVLSWDLLSRGYEIISEPTALAWTRVPDTLPAFARQRVRWARGMLEGIREHGWGVLRAKGRAWHGVISNCIFPFIDIAYVCFFLPGLVLAATGNFALAGPWTLFLLPLVLLLSLVIYKTQSKVFHSSGYSLRHNRLGYLLYIIFYQPLVSCFALFGYGKELTGRKRNW